MLDSICHKSVSALHVANTVEARGRDVLFDRRQHLCGFDTKIYVEYAIEEFCADACDVFDPPPSRFSIHLSSHFPEPFHIEIPPRHQNIVGETCAFDWWSSAKTGSIRLTIAHLLVIVLEQEVSLCGSKQPIALSFRSF